MPSKLIGLLWGWYSIIVEGLNCSVHWLVKGLSISEWSVDKGETCGCTINILNIFWFIILNNSVFLIQLCFVILIVLSHCFTACITQRHIAFIQFFNLGFTSFQQSLFSFSFSLPSKISSFSQTCSSHCQILLLQHRTHSALTHLC